MRLLQVGPRVVLRISVIPCPHGQFLDLIEIDVTVVEEANLEAFKRPV